jgi:WD40 repeat protein
MKTTVVLLSMPFLLLTAAANTDPSAAKRGPVKPRLTLRGHPGVVFLVAFSPDGKDLAAASSDGTVTVWDPASGVKRFTLRAHRHVVSCLCFSPDGQSLATADGTTLKIWDTATRRVRLTLPGHGNVFPSGITEVAFSPNGRHLASAGFQRDRTGEVLLRDVRTGRQVAAFRGPHVGASNPAFTADGKRLATVGREGGPAVWELASGSAALRVGGKGPLDSVALSPDGRRLAGSGRDGMVRVWALPSGEECLALAGHKGEVARVAFSSCGKWLGSLAQHFIPNGGMGVLAGEVFVWDAVTGQRMLLLAFRSGELPFDLAWAPDGSFATGHEGGTVKIWSVRQLLRQARSGR